MTVVAMGEVDSLTQKFGVGAVVATVGVLMGKYFAFRPKTIESQAAARRSDIQNIQDHNAKLVEQINETHKEFVNSLKDVHKSHVDNLMASIADLNANLAIQRSRADRNEAKLTNSSLTKHALLNELNRLCLPIQEYQILLREHSIEFTSCSIMDVTNLLKAEDDANKILTDRTARTSEAVAVRSIQKAAPTPALA